MYFMPGGVILRSYDLANWEIATYIFDKLDDTDSERLEGDETNYGKGMWAASLRYHEGKFYVAFVSHGRQDTHLFIADDIEGPWEHKLINGYFHDCSLLFDDGRVFVVSGNTEIRLTELAPDFSGPKEGGIDKIIIRDNREDVILGYEGAHFYKINGKYYITLIHWPKYNGRRTEAVFVSETVDGEYVGRDVMDDDMGFYDRGVAQGGLSTVLTSQTLFTALSERRALQQSSFQRTFQHLSVHLLRLSPLQQRDSISRAQPSLHQWAPESSLTQLSLAHK